QQQFGIKISKPGTIPQQKAKQELDVLKKLKCPNIIQLVDSFEFNQQLCFVFPFRTETLQQFLNGR
ncbi:hypothetical protein EOM81_13330, partial [bacterium]|nr:hypothetical protein [bacterium]